MCWIVVVYSIVIHTSVEFEVTNSNAIVVAVVGTLSMTYVVYMSHAEYEPHNYATCG